MLVSQVHSGSRWHSEARNGPYGVRCTYASISLVVEAHLRNVAIRPRPTTVVEGDVPSSALAVTFVSEGAPIGHAAKGRIGELGSSVR